MRFTRIASGVLFISIAADASACLQMFENGLNIRGQRVVTTQKLKVAMTLQGRDTLGSAREQWRRERDRLGKAAANSSDFRVHNDFGVALVHLGESARAIAIFEAIERKHPGRAETAANLGTALELTGRDADALRWIREGIRRNEAEHSGTEWLHVRILEAKLALVRDSKWLLTHSVSGADFGSADRPKMPALFPRGNNGVRVKPGDFRKGLQYQIGERLEFVKKPDAIMADLLFDWGNIEALIDVVDSAQDLYTFSSDFGHPRNELLQRRRAFMKKLLAEPKAPQPHR